MEWCQPEYRRGTQQGAPAGVTVENIFLSAKRHRTKAPPALGFGFPAFECQLTQMAQAGLSQVSFVPNTLF
jgi:hypothetical protein